MYVYDFEVNIFCGLPVTSSMMTAIKNGENRFNSIIRDAYKRLTISLIPNGKLHYHLESDISIDKKNWLRCTQICSKEASKDSSVKHCIRPHRLFTR